MRTMHSASGHHQINFSNEGVPLESSAKRAVIALGSVGAILALIVTVFAVAY